MKTENWEQRQQRIQARNTLDQILDTYMSGDADPRDADRIYGDFNDLFRNLLKSFLEDALAHPDSDSLVPLWLFDCLTIPHDARSRSQSEVGASAVFIFQCLFGALCLDLERADLALVVMDHKVEGADGRFSSFGALREYVETPPLFSYNSWSAWNYVLDEISHSPLVCDLFGPTYSFTRNLSAYYILMDLNNYSEWLATEKGRAPYDFVPSELSALISGRDFDVGVAQVFRVAKQIKKLWGRRRVLQLRRNFAERHWLYQNQGLKNLAGLPFFFE